MLVLTLAMTLAAAQPGPLEYSEVETYYEPYYKCIRLSARHYATKSPTSSATEIGTTATVDCDSVAIDSKNRFSKFLIEMNMPPFESRDVSEMIEQLHRYAMIEGKNRGIAEVVKARSRK